MSGVQLEVMPWQLAVCKLVERQLPNWSKNSTFLSFVQTVDEVSLVCEAACVPEAVKVEKPWCVFRVAGQLDFSLVGILAGITDVLKRSKISVFVISTFDTDYILVKEDTLEAAKKALIAAGYPFVE